MTKGEHKAKYKRALELAHALLDEQHVDITEQVHLPPLAKLLMVKIDISYDTAHRRVHQALMQRRGQQTTVPHWGSVRGGRPRKEKPPLKTVTIRAGNPIHANIVHPDGGYEPLGRGVVRIERSGAERLVKVDLGDGRTLVLTVFW